jgi:hypothetical protein
MSTTVLSFPPAVTCPECKRACSEDELMECPECGGTFCGSAKTGCKVVCACVRLALYLADLAKIYRQPSEALPAGKCC